MSLSITGIGANFPIYAPIGAPPVYAQNSQAAESVAATTTGAEAGAAAVVYEPSSSDAGQQLTYSNRDSAQKAVAVAAAQAHADVQHASFAGDESVVEATGGTVLPPPSLPETPHGAEVKRMIANVWEPVKPLMADPAMSAAATPRAPAAQDQAEASAQAVYAAVVDATIAGQSMSELEKFA